MGSENPYESPNSRGTSTKQPSLQAARQQRSTNRYLLRVAALTTIWFAAGLAGLRVSGRYHHRRYPGDIDPIFVDCADTVGVLIASWFAIGVVGTVVLALVDRCFRR